MEHLLNRAAILLLVLAAAACRRQAELERSEKKALEESVSQAQDQVHKLNMKEVSGEELTAEEAALRQRLKDQAEEDQHGGEGRPQPPAEASPDGG